MSREDLHLLLTRYLNNQSSDEEKLLVEKLYGMLDEEDLKAQFPYHSADLEQKLWENINFHSKTSAVQEREGSSHNMLWFLAAVISVITLLTGYLFVVNSQNPAYKAFQAYADLEEKRNTTDTLMTLNLEDGSKVILQPNSSLTSPTHFKPDQREVSLNGEAYFLISKDHKRPFFVYNKYIITRVVGTSFTVKSTKSSGQAEVTVSTGKVWVTPNQDRIFNLKRLFGKDLKAVLTPNQRTVYSPDRGDFETSLVPEPIAVTPPESGTGKMYLFKDTPVPEVLAKLEQSYEIQIVIQDREFTRDTFTGDLSGQGLYQKVNLICQSVKADYEITGTKIIIKKKKYKPY